MDKDSKDVRERIFSRFPPRFPMSPQSYLWYMNMVANNPIGPKFYVDTEGTGERLEKLLREYLSNGTDV